MNDQKVQNWQTIPGKKGLLFREHSTRKHQRKPDRFWAIRHTVDGKRTVETLGWTSEGWTMDMAMDLVSEMNRNHKSGTGPQTLNEKRKISTEAREASSRAAMREKAKDVTFEELAGHYRTWAENNRRSGSRVSRLLEKHVLPTLGSLKAAEISPAIIDNLRERLESTRPERGINSKVKGAGLSGQTILHCLKAVREVYNYARETPHPADAGMMLYSGSNPAVLSKRGRGITVPVFDSRRLRVLNDAEISLLLTYMGKNMEQAAELRDMILLSLDTGIRAGELVNLRREDVTPETGALRVFSGSDHGLTKSGRTRIVHAGQLFPQSLHMLRLRLSTPSPYIWIFPGVNGGMRNSTALSRAMQRLANLLHLNDGVTDARNRIVWHTLRHTFATHMLEKGVDIYTLKELLGHSSVSVTEGYLHLCDCAKREQSLARLALSRATLLRD